MTEFRLAASSPGSGIRQTLANATVVDERGVRRAVDIVMEDAVVLSVLNAGAKKPVGEILDLAGRIVIPGLWDRHVHFTQWAKMSRRLDVSAARSAAEAVSIVRDRIAQQKADRPAQTDDPVVAFGFRDALWPDEPTLAPLDEASGAREVTLVSGDLHAVWLNSTALARHGHAGHPTGLLREDAAFAVERALDSIPFEVSDRWALEAAADAAARGVTGIVDLEMAWNADEWRRRAAEGNTFLRVDFGIYPQDLERAISERFASGQILPRTHGLVEVGPFKAITDGSLNTRTAYCYDAYDGLSGPDAYGIRNISPEQLEAFMAKATGAGLRCAIHAIGDHANSIALDAFEATGSRGSIEHAQLFRLDDIARMATLGIAASVQPEHAMDDRDVADHHWHGRTDRAFMLRSFIDAGVGIALGSDAPVAPLDPWVTIAAAVGRSRDGREPWHPEQSITVAEALSASTRTSRIGIRGGDVADLVVLDADPFAASLEDLRRMPVAATLLNGRFTHRRI